MNLLAWADHALQLRALAFFAVTAVTTMLTASSVAKSRRLSEFFDALSDEHVSWRGKLPALRDVWPPLPPRQAG